MKIITCNECEEIHSRNQCNPESFAQGRPEHALPDALDAGYFIFKHCEECGNTEAAVTVRPDIDGILYVYDDEILSRG